MVGSAGARETVEIEGAAHAVPVSHADTVADVIFEATRYVEELAQRQSAGQ